MYDLIIIGGGPAGLTAGIYALRYGLSTLLIEKDVIAGQIAGTDIVENYPGFISIKGPELMEKFTEHATSMGVKIENAIVSSISTDKYKKIINTDNGILESKAVIISTGADPKKLDVPGESEFIGKGVSYCATCDAPFYKEKTVIVVGGGESAATDALILSNIAKKVYIIHRRDSLRASKILQERISQKNNIEIIWNTVIEKIIGKNRVTNVLLKNIETKSNIEMPIDGVFIYIGITPNTDFIEVEKNKYGFIITKPNLETSISGIYAAGDCRDTLIWQVVTAVADGAIAAVSVREALMNM